MWAAWKIVLLVLFLLIVVAVIIVGTIYGIRRSSSSESWTLVQESKTPDDFLNPSQWRLYIGRTAYSSPAALTGLVSKDFYWDTVNLTSLFPLMNPDGYYNGLYFQDPTNGIQSYLVGAANADILIARDESTGGTALKVMKFRNNKEAIQAGAPPFGMATLRLESTKLLRNAVVVIDAHQVPKGCGAWPAFWLVGTPNQEIWEQGINSGHAFDGQWPAYGEIDIIEQINMDLTKNHFTLHTSGGCTSTMTSSSDTTVFGDSNCNAGGPPAPILSGALPRDISPNNGTTGCSMLLEQPTMNKGVYVCQMSNESIRFWFFAEMPSSLSNASPSLNMDELGPPLAEHQLSSCPSYHFQNLRMVINLALCGDWAGNVTCQDSSDPLGISYVAGNGECAKAYAQQLSFDGQNSSDAPNIDVNNPEDPRLKDLQWILGAVRVYESKK